MRFAKPLEEHENVFLHKQKGRQVGVRPNFSHTAVQFLPGGDK